VRKGEDHMPWNDQSGGDNRGGQSPWGSGPRQPWGQPPRGPNRGGDGPPDLEELLRRFRERVRGSFGGRGGGRGDGERPAGPAFNPALIASAAAVLWAASGIYIVDEPERAAVLTFGAMTDEVGPGLHWHIPFPIQSVHTESVQGVRRIEVGRQASQDMASESLMITGDRNIVDIDFAVLYRLNNIQDYLFNVDRPDETVKGLAESAMREIIGQRDLQAIITTERAAVEAGVEEQLQQVLDAYDSGVQVVRVQLLDAQAPPQVREAFNEVVRAGQVAETTINQATQYANEVIPRARGEAAQITQAAEAYREQAIREATGDAERFTLVEGQYRAAPNVTRQRLYLETMERVIQKADTIIVDRGAGAVPILPLDQFRGGARTPSAPAPAAQPQQGTR
jgi:membrane protease subunit HflK